MTNSRLRPNEALRYHRSLRGWSQHKVADEIGASNEMISNWERGKKKTSSFYQEKLCALFGMNAEELGFLLPSSTDPAREAPVQEEPNDLNLPMMNGEKTVQAPDAPFALPLMKNNENTFGFLDWGEAPSPDHYYGREQERADLVTWVQEEQCRLVTIVGMGGIGKTSLAVALSNTVKDSFEYVFWRSLHHAPPLRTVLEECLKFLSNQQQRTFPDDINNLVLQLLRVLREHRCLLVLDNCETVIQGGIGTGPYRNGYEDYGQLFRRVGETHHQSCLLLTSREKPKEIALLEGKSTPVRSYHLAGLSADEGAPIIHDKGLVGNTRSVEELVNSYAGNPLALKLVSQFILEVFEGNITTFLQDGQVIFGDIQDILDQQVQRLSPLEQEIMYWLALEREAISWQKVSDNLVRPVTKQAIQTAIQSLQRRYLVETTLSGFTLQNVVMEYMTERFIAGICGEIREGTPVLLHSHALLQAQSKEYIREIQKHLILEPIAHSLLATFSKEESESILKNLLLTLHQYPIKQPSYAAGNILNLLVQLGCNLRGYDFSHLEIRQAYLQGSELFEVNFASADLSTTVFTDTFGSIFTVAFHPFHSLLAAGTASGEVRLWNIQTGVPLHTWQGHTDWVRSVAFSPDGRIIASGSEDKTIRVWEVGNGQCLHTLQGHQSRIRSVAFSLDGKLIASGSEDETIRLWDATTGACINVLQGHTDQVRTIVFQPHGDMIASGCEDETIRLWDVTTGACIDSFNAQVGSVFSLAFSPNGQLLASGGNDPIVRLWEVESRQCLKSFQGHISRVRSVGFSPDGQTITSGSEDRTVRLWSVETGQFREALRGHANTVFSVSFNPEGSIIASGSEDQTIRIWDVFTAHCLRTLRGYTNEVRAIAFSPDGTTIVSGNEDHTVKLWKLGDGQVHKMLRGHQSRIRAVAFSPDGILIASGSEDSTVKLWEVTTGRCLRTLHGHTNRVRSVTFSPDRALVASGSEDYRVKLWSTGTGECLATLYGHTNKVRSVAFSPDGSLVASGSEDQTIRLWTVKTGACWRILQERGSWIWSLTFSPDGNLVASGCEDQTVRIWDVHTGECLKILLGHTDRVRSVAFSPDGQILASGSEDQTIQLWDVNTGACVKVLQGHVSWIWAVAFSPDGNTIAGGSHDGTIKIWYTQTGECLSTLRSSRPYELMNITHAKGLTPALQSMLKVLGAVENRDTTS